LKVDKYIEKSGLFSFDKLKCLRNEYLYNDCQECIDICPHDAMVIEKQKLTLVSDECTACASCIGGCPTEALSLENFDPNRFVIEFCDSKENMISKKTNVPCLGVFAPDHFISILLRKETDIKCDLSDYEDEAIKTAIISRIEESNRFVSEIGFEYKIIKVEKTDEDLSRRALFKKAINSVKESSADQNISDEIQKRSKSPLPVKRTILKNSIKRKLEDIDETTISGNYSFSTKKKITKDCTNCGDCVTFCPTDALFRSSDGAKYLFSEGKCIDCDICNDICKTKAVVDEIDHDFDLVSFAFDRAQVLIEHDLRVCKMCKCAFSYKGGEEICDRCENFENDFGDIFKLASDGD